MSAGDRRLSCRNGHLVYTGSYAWAVPWAHRTLPRWRALTPGNRARYLLSILPGHEGGRRTRADGRRRSSPGHGTGGHLLGGSGDGVDTAIACKPAYPRTFHALEIRKCWPSPAYLERGRHTGRVPLAGVAESMASSSQGARVTVGYAGERAASGLSVREAAWLKKHIHARTDTRNRSLARLLSRLSPTVARGTITFPCSATNDYSRGGWPVTF